MIDPDAKVILYINLSLELTLIINWQSLELKYKLNLDRECIKI
jgi:hypothetical protein